MDEKDEKLAKRQDQYSPYQQFIKGRYMIGELLAINGPPKLTNIDEVSMRMHFSHHIPLSIDQLMSQLPLLSDIKQDSKSMKAFMGRKLKETGPIHDFDEEAKRLYAKLNLPDPTEKRDAFMSYDVPDVVWVHPENGAKFYIGNIGSAQNINVLSQLKIFHIVNCQGTMGDNF
jgi:hypothetical protein